MGIIGHSKAALAVSLLAGALVGVSSVPRPAYAEPPVYTQKELDQMRARITRYERREAEALAALEKGKTPWKEARYNELHAYVIQLTERWYRESERTRTLGEPAPQPKTNRVDTASPPSTARRSERPRRERRSPPSTPERSFEGGGISVGSGG